MSQKFVIEIERYQVLLAIGVINKIGAPGAFLLGKLQKQIENFLLKFPKAEKFRLTAEAIDSNSTAPLETDREASEEQAGNHESPK